MKKIKIFIMFLLKRFVSLFPKKIENDEIKKIIKSLENNSFYCYKNFFTSDQIEKIKKGLALAEEKSISDGDIVEKDLTNKKKRIGNIAEMNLESLNLYTKNNFILEVSKYFHGIEVKSVTRSTYEVKELGSNPENSPLKDRKDDTIFFHFDRPYKVLKTFLILEDISDKDGPFQVVQGSHKIGYKSPLKKIMRYLSKIFFFRHHYLLSKEDEKYFINKEDIVYCKGNKGDLYFVNTEAWHCGRPLSASGKREVLWNYIYSDSLIPWIKHIITGKFLKI